MLASDALPPTRLTFDKVAFSRGARTLFSELSFVLEPGQIFWIMGDNGIGKTSILKLAMGFLKPDSGEITCQTNGRSIPVEQCIGYIGHADAFEPLLTVRETLAFWAEIYDADPDLNTLIEGFGLSEQINLRTSSLSAGQKRRLALARLSLSNRPIWIMDEPKAAMDQTGQELIASILERHLQRGGSALVASHYDASAIGKHSRKLVLETAR